MFSRSPDSGSRSFHDLAHASPPPAPPLPQHQSQQDVPRSTAAQPATRTAQREDGVSVIGRDLAIIGAGLRIVSRGKIQIDGVVRGDVYGDEIVINNEGSVAGTVAATRITVRGSVHGTIRAQEITLQSTAHVEGDLHHASLTLEQGATFEGRSRRPADPATLLPDIDGAMREDGQANAPVVETRPDPMANLPKPIALKVPANG